MKIREYQNGDEIQISDLIRDALRNHQYDFKEQDPKLVELDIKRYSSSYIKELSKRAQIFVAILNDGDNIAGVGCLENGEVNTCYIRGDMQKRGIGKALLIHIESIAKEIGIGKLTLYSNFYSEPFYKSRGFKVIKRMVIDYYGTPWNASYMEKEL